MRSGPDQRSRDRFNANRPSHPQPRGPQHNQTLDSHGPGERIRGSASQIYQRYLTLAKRREVTIGSPPKTTTNTRSTISASTTRVVVATQRAHHLSEARPYLASWPSPVKLLKIRHHP